MNTRPAIAIVPVRSAPAFAATAIDTVPPPVPDAPDTTVIHGTSEVAVQAQPLAPVTLTLAVPAAAATRTDAADSAKLQLGGRGGGGAGVGVGSGVGFGGGGVGEGVGVGVGVGGGAVPASVTTTIWPPTRTVPERSPPEFWAARSEIDALPVPDAGPAIVSQAASLTAVHGQPFSVSSAIVIDPPLTGTAAFDGEALNRQGAGSWVTISCVLLTSRIARRTIASGFARTL